jgi:hypothetical protein
MQPTGPESPGTQREPGVIVLPGTPRPHPVLTPPPIRKQPPSK